jgi:hypothetical protein
MTALALSLALSVALAAAGGAAPMPDTAEFARRLEAQRAENQAWLRESPNSYFAAIQRVDFGERKSLTVGSGPEVDVRLDDPAVHPKHLVLTVEGEEFTVTTLAPTARFKRGGELLSNARLGPGALQVSRFTLRLSHQGFPAVIVFDPQSPRLKDVPNLQYFPIDPKYRLVVALTPNPKPETVTILSTRGHRRQAVRVGWFDFTLDGRKLRLEATRLLEPGIGENELSVLFRDATTGKESYPVGRYLDPERQADGTYALDFNAAYNPACAYSPHYNCPIPPRENRLPVAIRAGEKAPAAH